MYDPFIHTKQETCVHETFLWNWRSVFINYMHKYIDKQNWNTVVVATTKFSLLKQFNFAAPLVQKARRRAPHQTSWQKIFIWGKKQTNIFLYYSYDSKISIFPVFILSCKTFKDESLFVTYFFIIPFKKKNWTKTALLMLHLNDVCVAMEITVTS